jgi:hypothetical protein
MHPSPLQLIAYRLFDIQVTSRTGFEPDQEDTDSILDEMVAQLDMHEDVEKRSEGCTFWTVFLDLGFEGSPGKHTPYDFRVSLLTEFLCAAPLPAKLKDETIVGVNGTSIAYGIARELIQTLTEKSVWGALTLPTMSFTNFRELLPPADT